MADKLTLADLQKALKETQEDKQLANSGLEEAKKLKASLTAAQQVLKGSEKGFQEAEE